MKQTPLVFLNRSRAYHTFSIFATQPVRTAIVHWQMHTVANTIREWRHIQLAHFVLDPSAISFALLQSQLYLRCHHFSGIRLLLFDSIGIIFGLETAQIDLYVLFRHGKALVSEKLFDRVNIDSLLDHICGYRMPKLMRCYQLGVIFLLEVGSQFLEGTLDQLTGKDSLLCPKQVMCLKVVWKLLDSLLLTTNGINYPIAGTSRDTVFAPHFCVGGINANPPVAI